MRTQVVLVGLCVLSVALFALSLYAGTSASDDRALESTFITLRSTRGAVAYLVGVALAVGGVLVQGLFRNPLASPDVLGTSAGASLFGKLALLCFQLLLGSSSVAMVDPELFLPLGCFAGALLGLTVLLHIARKNPDAVVLLLAGFLLSSLFLSIGSFVTSLAQESWELGRAVIAFALGGLSGAGPRQLAIVAPVAIIGTLAAVLWARPLDLLLSGEDEARVLGLDVTRARRWCIAWTALLTSAAVAVGGNIGFVGLVVPHALRHVVGVSHRLLVPAAALGGGCFVLACDIATRVIPAHTELPLGVVTGLVGAPLFLALLLRARREVLYG
jgi:iron complex transport system permease protein